MACDAKDAPGAPSLGQALPEVAVVVIKAGSVTVMSDLPGRTSAYRSAEVRARVDGIILKREFVEGSNVKAGERLYLIDPASYQAAYNSAKAGLSKANANFTAKKLRLDRVKELLEHKAVSQQAGDDAVAEQQRAEADVAAAKAALEEAHIWLSYTAVTSPIDGRIGKSLVTEGAYVRQGEATPLATIQQLDPMYVDVAQSNAELLRLRRGMEQGTLQSLSGSEAKVSLILEDGSVYGEIGSLQFSDSTVDAGTGSVTLRALFPNKELRLLPGMFVHARLATGVIENGILVSQQAVTFNAKGQATALVVGADEKVELRTLQVNHSMGNQWLVNSGLQEGDRVIVEGLQKVKPGTQVKIADSK